MYIDSIVLFINAHIRKCHAVGIQLVTENTIKQLMLHFFRFWSSVYVPKLPNARLHI
jgi:hypothetical protein